MPFQLPSAQHLIKIIKQQDQIEHLAGDIFDIFIGKIPLISDINLRMWRMFITPEISEINDRAKAIVLRQRHDW